MFANAPDATRNKDFRGGGGEVENEEHYSLETRTIPRKI